MGHLQFGAIETRFTAFTTDAIYRESYCQQFHWFFSTLPYYYYYFIIDLY